MKQLYDEKNTEFSTEPIQLRPREFSDDDICVLKALFLEIEKVIDGIELSNSTNDKKMEGSYVFKLLQGADVSIYYLYFSKNNYYQILNLNVIFFIDNTFKHV